MLVLVEKTNEITSSADPASVYTACMLILTSVWSVVLLISCHSKFIIRQRCDDYSTMVIGIVIAVHISFGVVFAH